MAAVFVILGSYSIAAPNGGGDCNELRIFGYTAAGKLIRFEDDKPLFAWTVGTVSGLAGDTALVGIDYRPADGKLYGLGNAGGVYTINTFNAVATFKSQLDVALSGTSFGVDFNPTVDRLRVVSDNGQNLRVNVDTGATTTDTALNYTGPAALGIAGAAYTNNDADPNTATTLYDIDTMLDQAAIQAPPNSGTLNPTGKLLVDTTQDVGFDIYSRMDNGNIVETLGFAALRVGTRSRLYRIDLFTGKARLRGSFASHHHVVGLAIPLNQF
jgi:hypothetical protein